MNDRPTEPTGYRVRRWALLAGALCASCSASTGTDANSQSSDVFLAFADDFRGYHSWPSFDVSAFATLAGIHDGSHIVEYLNQLPPAGSSAFPLRTIVVKEATGGALGDNVFAQVKRGGGYNRAVPDWEWFELANLGDAADSVNVVWRGVGPPAGEKYGGDPNAGCNTCHSSCLGNDGVCSPALQLSELPGGMP